MPGGIDSGREVKREVAPSGRREPSGAARRRLPPRRVAGLPVSVVRRALEEERDIETAYLFGSQARGTARSGSDVDVAVIFTSTLGPVERLERRLDLIHKLEDCLSKPVDVVDMESAPCVLAHQVLKHGALLLDRNPRRRVAIEVRRRQEYLDGLRYRQAYLKALLARLMDGRPEGDAAR